MPLISFSTNCRREGASRRLGYNFLLYVPEFSSFSLFSSCFHQFKLLLPASLPQSEALQGEPGSLEAGTGRGREAGFGVARDGNEENQLSACLFLDPPKWLSSFWFPFTTNKGYPQKKALGEPGRHGDPDKGGLLVQFGFGRFFWACGSDLISGS